MQNLYHKIKRLIGVVWLWGVGLIFPTWHAVRFIADGGQWSALLAIPVWFFVCAAIGAVISSMHSGVW